MMITTFKVDKDYKEHAQNIDDKWNEFVECFLIRKESYIISHSGEIFTQKRVEHVLELFDKNTKRSDVDKLKKQFAKASVEEKLIFLHAEWIYFLVSNITKNTRRKKLSIWGDKIREDVLLEKIIFFPGKYYDTAECWCIGVILELFRDICAELSGHNKWIEQYCLKRQCEMHMLSICSALLYIVNPNDYEPIVRSDKDKIAEYYKNLLDSVDESVDKNILNIRQALTKKYSEQHFSFHNERTEWKLSGNTDTKNNHDKNNHDKNNHDKNNHDKNNHDKNNEDTPPDENPNPLNQILYGPPGTGKTWNTVNYALGAVLI